MVLFSGKSLGEAFNEEASDPFDLCSKLFPKNGNVEKDYRMWIEVPTKGGGKYWFDICLNTLSTATFEFVMGRAFLDGAKEVNVTIRGATDHSPNASPDEKPLKPLTETPPEILIPTSPVSHLQAAVSNLTEATSELTIAPSGSYDTYDAVNVKEPITQADISSAPTGLIPLYFPKIRRGRLVSQEVVLVDLDGLEQLVVHQCKNAKSAVGIHLAVECRDGKVKRFCLTESVWVGSILERSRTLRSLFATETYVECCRDEQLRELKDELPDLYAKVRYWIADMLNFEEAQGRLQTPMEARNVPVFMSPYYFSEMEARYLGNFYVPGSVTVKSLLQTLVETEDNICTSHNLAPQLMRSFKIDKNFSKDPVFQKQCEDWRKAQELIWSGKPKGLGG